MKSAVYPARAGCNSNQRLCPTLFDFGPELLKIGLLEEVP
tara:strand:+ start:460 stop:579 length:120 start_codon:yes stop_codon:yes gene_type:complete